MTERLRLTPQDFGAEAGVVGSMIVDPRCIGDIVELLTEQDFTAESHRAIWRTVIYLWQQHPTEAIDGLTVRSRLESSHELDAAGGIEGLKRVIETVPSAANARYYAAIVRAKARQRELVRAGQDIIEMGYGETGSDNIQDLMEQAEGRLFEIVDRNIRADAQSAKDLVVRAFESIEKRKGDIVTGIPTGFHELDNITCGLQKGDMVIVAARPSMGKTAIALNMAESAGVTHNLPVLIFSMEMGKQQIMERFLAGASGLPATKLKRGGLTSAEFTTLAEAAGRLSPAPIYIDDTSSFTPLILRSKARRCKHQYGIQLVILDYLQLMTCGRGKIENRQQEITEISRSIKGLARELDVPVIAVSQLNRLPEGRTDRRPRMSDLRESGSLEQDADVIILLHREDYYHEGEADWKPQNTADVHVAKQRNGATGTITLTFRREVTRFANCAKLPEGLQCDD